MTTCKLFVAIALVTVLSIVAGCAATPAAAPVSPTQAPTAAEATSAPAAVEPTSAPVAESGGMKQDPIVVAVWSGPEHDNAVKVAAEYEKATGNKVIIEEIARDAYFSKLTTTFVGGGKDYDAAYVMSDWVPAWVKAGALKDLDGFVSDPKVAMPGMDLDVFGKATDFFTFDGKLYALPSEGDTAWLWYRKDLFEEKGIKVPETWDEYLAAAKALNNPPEIYGTVIGAKPDEAWWDFMYYIFGQGGDLLGPDFKPVIDDEKGVAALKFYADLAKEKLVPPDVNTYGYNEIMTTLKEGKAAMGIQWMAATQELTDCNASPKVCRDGKPLLGYTLVPGVKQADGSIERHTGGSQWSWAIPSGSEKQEAAYKFIEWLTSKDGAKLWAMNGGIPGNMEALSDPEVVAKVPQFKMLAEVMPYRSIFPALTVSPEMLPIVNAGIVDAVTGTKDPKQAAADIVGGIAPILKEAGYLK